MTGFNRLWHIVLASVVFLSGHENLNPLRGLLKRKKNKAKRELILRQTKTKSVVGVAWPVDAANGRAQPQRFEVPRTAAQRPVNIITDWFTPLLSTCIGFFVHRASPLPYVAVHIMDPELIGLKLSNLSLIHI